LIVAVRIVSLAFRYAPIARTGIDVPLLFWFDKRRQPLHNENETQLPKLNSSKFGSTMKHVLILAAAIVIALSGQVFARIGNTEYQVSALFGKPVDPGKPDSDGVTTNMYKNPTGEYIAVVQFLKGHSVAEAYSRVDSRKLSEKEVSIFLQGNSAGKEWKKDPRKLAWERSDHRATAWCETLSGRPTLLIQARY
jgi:hypothetical protein